MIIKKNEISWRYLFCCSALIFSASVNAMDMDNIQINGFGTIAGGITDEENTFRNTNYDSLLDWNQDSRMAIQVRADMGEGLSSTVQIYAEGSNEYQPSFEWAYVSYELSDESTIRAGRLRIPFYKYSDYLDVGYAYNFVRPPKSMYSLLFSTFDGISLVHNFTLADFDMTANLNFGNVTDSFFVTVEPTDGKLENMFAVNLSATKDFFSAYVAYVQTEVEIPRASVEGLANLLETGGPISPSINLAGGASADDSSYLRADGDKGTFFGVGFGIDYEDYLLNAEYSTVSVEDSIFLTNQQWYVMAGMRINEFTPFVIVEKTWNERDTSTAKLFTAVPDTIVVQTTYDNQRFSYKAATAGVRYDFHSNAALKLQYTHHYDIVDISSGFGTPDDKEKLDLLLVALDFVF